MATLQERARAAAKAGYTVSELINCPGFYFVHKPGAPVPYLVDLAAVSCNCEARVTCKHTGLVQLCLRFWLALDRKAAAPVRRRSLFSRRHLAALRAFQPMMAGPKPTPVTAPAPSAETIARQERMEAMMLRDFGPGSNY